MRYELVKIILFWALISAAPGVIFLVQVVLLMPANMMLAYLISGLAEQSGAWGLMLFIAVSLIVTIGVLTILAWLLAKLICLAHHPRVRNILLVSVTGGILSLLFLPIYGSGGHGPMRWTTAAGLEQGHLNYWTMVFPITFAVAGLHLWVRKGTLRRSD